MGSTRRQAAMRKAERTANPKLYRFCTEGLRRLLRVVGEHANGLDHIHRARYRRERRCVGCEEADGARFEPVLGWVCVHCDEVLDLVYEKEIEEVREARCKVQEFLTSMETGEQQR
jgi:hypothetical protein